MDAAEGEGEEQLGQAVAVGDGVHRVARHAVESQFGGDGPAVEIDGRAGQRAGAERADVQALAAIGEPAAVAS